MESSLVMTYGKEVSGKSCELLLTRRIFWFGFVLADCVCGHGTLGTTCFSRKVYC
ncbi:hypothetical protein HanIR_Chr10g0480051 [Helianthus annuus]|nr:hypothetical protein HanIR_Chr10g0480051 [Helianthus annuus]